MPSITFYTPWSSKRSGPSATNPMFTASQPKQAPTPEPEKQKEQPKSTAPQLPFLPDMETSSSSIINDADWSMPSTRHGKLKTVGGSEEDNDPAAMAQKDYKIPDFDFGPTLNFAAKELPVDKARAITAGAPSSLLGERQRSHSTCLSTTSQSSATLDARPSTSLNEQWRRFSKFNASSGGLSATSAASRPGTSMSHFRKISGESRSSARPDGHHRRTSSGLHSMYSMGNASGLALHNANARMPSRMLTPESMEHARPSSRGNGGHSRNNSGESGYSARPYSHGAGAASGRPELVSHLSAREHEAVARMTGGPLINLANSPASRSSSAMARDAPGGGLVGAIDARQREKEALRAAGAYNPSVAYAIRERQTAAVMQQMQAAQAQSLALQSQQMQMQLQAQWQAQQEQQAMLMMMGAPRTMTMGSGMTHDMGMHMNAAGYAPSMGARSVYGVPAAVAPVNRGYY